MIYIGDALHGGLESQAWPYDIIQSNSFTNVCKIHSHLHRQNCVRVHPHAHQQYHMVPNHFVYIWCKWEMHIMGAWSLNHDLITSPVLSPSPCKIHSHLHRHNCVRVHPHAHQQHNMVPKHFVYIWYKREVHFMRVWSLNHDLATSPRLAHSPIFIKSIPSCTSITV